MSTEIHTVIMLVLGIVLLLNSIPAAGLVLYFGITQAVLYCAGYFDDNETEEEDENGTEPGPDLRLQ